MPALKNWDTNAEEALKHVQARYKSLSIYGGGIAKLSQESGLPVPLDLLNTYNIACNDYTSFANKVFELLHNNKMQVEQVIMTKGEPALSEDGQVRTVRIDMPLQPPVFPYQKGATQRIGQGAPLTTEMGLAPLAVGAYMVLGALIIGVTGYFTIEVLREVRMFFQEGPDYDADKQLDAFNKCVEEARGRGFSPQEILTLGCQKLLEMPPARGTRWSGIVLGLAALGAGIYVVPKVFGPKG